MSNVVNIFAKEDEYHAGVIEALRNDVDVAMAERRAVEIELAEEINSSVGGIDLPCSQEERDFILRETYLIMAIRLYPKYEHDGSITIMLTPWLANLINPDCQTSAKVLASPHCLTDELIEACMLVRDFAQSPIKKDG